MQRNFIFVTSPPAPRGQKKTPFFDVVAVFCLLERERESFVTSASHTESFTMALLPLPVCVRLLRRTRNTTRACALSLRAVCVASLSVEELQRRALRLDTFEREQVYAALCGLRVLLGTRAEASSSSRRAPLAPALTRATWRTLDKRRTSMTKRFAGFCKTGS